MKLKRRIKKNHRNLKVGNSKQHRRKVRDIKLENRACKHGEKNHILLEAKKEIDDFLDTLEEELNEEESLDSSNDLDGPYYSFLHQSLS